jgi:hypothetical protein
MRTFPLTYSASLAIVGETGPQARPEGRVVMTTGATSLGETIRRASTSVVHYMAPEALGGAGYTSVLTTIEASCAGCGGAGKVFHGPRKPATKCKACKGAGASIVVAEYVTNASDLPWGFHGGVDIAVTVDDGGPHSEATA